MIAATLRRRAPVRSATTGHPVSPDVQARRTAWWVVALLLAEILLQRLAIPGQPAALLWPIAVAWTALALGFHIVEVDPRRLTLWCMAEALSGLSMLLQTAFLSAPVISVNSWLLLTLVWSPAVTRFVDRRLSTYQLALQWSMRVFAGLAATCVVMMGSQFAGLRYHDWVGDLIPHGLQLAPFAISYPLTFGSPIYKSNAWIGLEPSFVSFQLGIGVLVAMLVRADWKVLVLLFVGLGTTASGSGFLVLLAGLPVILFSAGRRAVLPYVAPIGAVALAVVFTPLGQGLLDRADEASTSGSSASLRSVLPYEVLWPTWSSDVLAALVGWGPGSSQRITEGSGIAGLLVPTPAKIIFDYGLVAGAGLVVLLLFCYVESPSVSLAFALFVSLWLIQPGNQPVTAIPVLLFVTLWAPRVDRRAEDVLDPAVTGAPHYRRAALLR